MFYYATNQETAIAKRVVAAILGEGYSVRIFDGEEWAGPTSHVKHEIWEQMNATEEDIVHIREKTEDGWRSVGCIYLIYGNGKELISDHTDNEVTNRILAIVG